MAKQSTRAFDKDRVVELTTNASTQEEWSAWYKVDTDDNQVMIVGSTSKLTPSGRTNSADLNVTMHVVAAGSDQTAAELQAEFEQGGDSSASVYVDQIVRADSTGGIYYPPITAYNAGSGVHMYVRFSDTAHSIHYQADNAWTRVTS